ncbi:hypothetical protein TrVE_jg3583 [Triparma verrucosa]|uniref:Myb-like domain-containing protein n=1 Tax=Triparma verrucosa TaxID=1606542 RepID=A0A9W7F728_9STRA|nr:hypothetical protein TrVE_jg3583 [Triparma verrucosa]
MLEIVKVRKELTPKQLEKKIRRERKETEIAALPRRTSSRGEELPRSLVEGIPHPSKSKWSKEEDAILIEAIGKLGASWEKIVELLPGRSKSGCSTHWKNLNGVGSYLPITQRPGYVEIAPPVQEPVRVNPPGYKHYVSKFKKPIGEPPFVKPRGRPPLGKGWDELLGVWTDEEQIPNKQTSVEIANNQTSVEQIPTKTPPQDKLMSLVSVQS